MRAANLYSRPLLAALVFAFSITFALADTTAGKLNKDVTVGAVTLKAGQSVQVMGKSGGKMVISVTSADGSSAVYQVAAADVTIGVPAPPPAPVPTPAPAAAPAPVAASPPPATNAPPDDSAAPRTPTAVPNLATAYGPAPSGTPVSVFGNKPAPGGATKAPGYPKGFAGLAEFETTAGKKSAGTASVVHIDGETQTFIITARHLLGPDGGFDKQTAAPDVPAFVQGINFLDFNSDAHTHYAVTGLVVPATTVEAGANGSPMDDMAVFQNQDGGEQDNALPLAEKMPKLHEQLWVVAQVQGGVPKDQVMQPCKVDRFFAGWTVVQFDNDAINSAGASGAPVINESGQVVGVYAGHNSKDGHVYAFIIPSPLIVQVIKSAGQ